MPLGIARLNTLARYIAEAVSPPAASNLDAISLSSSDYLYMAGGEQDINETDNRTATWSVWFKLANSSSRSVPFGVRTSASGGTNSGRLFAPFLFNSSGVATGRFYHQTTTQTIDRTSTETGLYTTGEWVHMCASYDTTTPNSPIQLYINGSALTVSDTSTINSNFPYDKIDVWVNGYSDGSQTNDIEVAQIYWNNAYTDLSTNIDKFYDTTNSTAVDMGSDGTSTGLPQPIIYLNGDSTGFVTNGGRASFTLSVNGSISTTTGPEVGAGGAPAEETYDWTYWDGTNNGSVVVAHDDTVSSDGTTRHRVTMFDDTYGVVSYDKGSDTSMYWRQFSVADTTITLGSENQISALTLGSHTTAQYAITVNSTKAIHGYANSTRQIDYAVFTLSGSTVSASGAKSLSLGTTYNYSQHTNINKLTTDTFVIDGMTACAVLTWNSSNDTLTFEDEISYTGAGNFNNVSLYFTPIDTSKWMFAGGNTSSGISAQVFQYSSGSISTVGSASTYSIPSGYVTMSRAIQNPINQNNPVIAVALTNSSTNALNLTPVKYDTGSSSISVGSTYTYTPSASTYFRVDNSIWNGDTLTGIYGGADGRNYGITFDYDNATNTISASSNATEHELSEDAGYIFQGYRSARIDDERAVFAWSESGVDTSGDLQLRVLKGNVASAGSGLSRPYTITPFGNAEVDTAQVKYGTGSLLPNGGRLEAEMDMPSSDFTIEGWYRINNRSAVSGLWEIKDDSNSSRLALYGGEAGGGFKVLYLTYSDSSGTEQIDIVTPTNTFPDTTWKHCAVTKNGNTFTVWIDGVDRGSATYSSFVMPTTTTLGVGGSISDNRYFRGNADEFRVSDTARYTTGFTAPSGEFSNDSNTLLLVHMNGADGSTTFTDDDS